MKKAILLIMLAALLLVAGCSSAPSESSNSSEDVEVESDAAVEIELEDEIISADIDGDGIIDTEISTEDNVVEVEVDIDDVEPVEDFCVPGSTYTYSGADGSVDSEVIGLTTYKGSEFCQAESVTVINSPAGEMTADTTYYFDQTYDEFWVVTTISSDMMPAPQVSEVHIVDGEVQN